MLGGHQKGVWAHVAPPAARQLSSAVHLSTVGGLGCAATRPESVERAAAARTRSAQLAASPGQRRSSRRHPNSPEQPLPTLILTPSHCRAKNVGVDEKRAVSRTHADFPCEQSQPSFKSTVTGGSCTPAPSPSHRPFHPLSHPGASTAPTRMGFLFLVKHLCLPSLALWHETCLNIRGACVWVEPRGRGAGGRAACVSVCGEGRGARRRTAVRHVCCLRGRAFSTVIHHILRPAVAT